MRNRLCARVGVPIGPGLDEPAICFSPLRCALEMCAAEKGSHWPPALAVVGLPWWVVNVLIGLVSGSHGWSRLVDLASQAWYLSTSPLNHLVLQ
jgi:hypothetical protein